MGILKAATKVEAEARALTLAEEMKPLLLVMRGINIMPIRFSTDGGVTCSWRSRVALLSLVGWVVTFADVLHETDYRLRLFVQSRNFSDAVFQTFFFMLLHHHFLTPFIHWPAAPSLADYLADWTRFQGRFQRVTGRSLHLSARSLATHKAAAALLVPLVLCSAVGVALETANWLNLPLGWVAAVFHASVPAFWDVLGTAAVNASNALSSQLKEEVEVAGGTPRTGRIREYRDLWLELHSLAKRASSAWGLSTLHYLVCCISAVLLNGFGLLAEAVQGGNADSVMSVGMFLVTVDSLWHTAVVCGAGQRMASSVGHSARDVLLAMRTGADVGLQREVMSFLNVMRKPLTISLSGFLTLKLTLIVTIIQTLITYLCILLQFTINFQYQEITA